MERFVINYPLNGTKGKLFVEQMDHDNHRYSIERDNEDRKLYDSKPVIIEKSESGSWSLATESDWLVNESQAGEIGRIIEKHHAGDEGFETGINAK